MVVPRKGTDGPYVILAEQGAVGLLLPQSECWVSSMQAKMLLIFWCPDHITLTTHVEWIAHYNL